MNMSVNIFKKKRWKTQRRFQNQISTKNDPQMGRKMRSKTGPEASEMAYEAVAKNLWLTELEKLKK